MAALVLRRESIASLEVFQSMTRSYANLLLLPLLIVHLLLQVNQKYDPPPTGTTSSEELAVDKASTFNVEDHIPAASPRTAAANSTIKVDAPAVEKEEVDHDTDSTVTEDERDTISKQDDPH